MRDCLILGSPRGGTSLLAGSLHSSGYFMGDHLWPADDFNPKGQFEDLEVNAVNELLLNPLLPTPPRPVRWVFKRHQPVFWQRWLAIVDVGAPVACPPEIGRRIEALVSRRPYCFKDPRFSYTLPAWRPHIEGTVLLCIFREPSRTANSVVDCVSRNARLSNLDMDYDDAINLWTTMYEHILRVHMRSGEWEFVHYDQMLDGSAAERLQNALGVSLDLGFPDERLRRSQASGHVPPKTAAIYEELCELAEVRTVQRIG